MNQEGESQRLSMSKYEKDLFLKARFGKDKRRLRKKELEVVSEVRLALTTVRPSGLEMRPAYRDMLRALQKCGGNVHLLREMGMLARCEMGRTKYLNSGNALLQTINNIIRKRSV